MDITILNSLYTDAIEEYNNHPQFFNEMFYDPKNNINLLKNSTRFIVIGRKGTGKTALKQKFSSDISSETSDVIDLQINSSDFDYFLNQIDVDEIFLVKAWQLFILLKVFKYLNEKKILSDKLSLSKDIENLIYLSNRNIFKNIVSKMTLDVNLKTKHIDLKTTVGPTSQSININITIEKMISLLKASKKNKKIYITIDSLDFFLSNNNPNGLTYVLSLINASRELNSMLKQASISLKTILFIREEMFSDLVFHDKNKLKKDCSIVLKWEHDNNPKNSDIFNMLYSRFRCSGYNRSVDDFIKELNHYFEPTKYDFFSRFMEISLNRPRDILMYLKCCKEICGKKEQLDVNDLKRIDHAFSEEYFMDEVKDELTGHFNDEFIRDLSDILYKLPEDRFSYNTWREIVLRHNESFDDSLVNDSLKRMYEFGFIGLINLSHSLDTVQKRIDETPIYIFEKTYIKFSTKNCSYCLHRGIRKGLYEK